MGKIVNIPEKEMTRITKRSSLVGMDYNPTTKKECKQLYLDAPQIAEVTKAAVKDGLQGKALLTAKKLICGDEWDAKRLSSSLKKKWEEFFLSLGASERNVAYLLDFAGYKVCS